MSRKFHFSSATIDSLQHFSEMLLHHDAEGEKREQNHGIDGMAPLGPAASVVPMAVSGINASDEEAKEPTPEEVDRLQKAVDRKPEPIEDTEYIVCRTDVGILRSSNQDALIRGTNVFGVADGMGGHNGGEIASGMAAALMTEALKDKQPALAEMNEAVKTANSIVYAHSVEQEGLSGMGTTLTCAWFDKENIFIGHVGDSRAYRLRDGELRQMTSDHSYVGELVRQGLITREQAECHPMRNVITRAVGTEESIDVDVLWHKRRTGDRWLICSDGLYGMINEKQLSELVQLDDLSNAADALLQAALDGGGRDNITLVLFDDREGAV